MCQTHIVEKVSACPVHIAQKARVRLAYKMGKKSICVGDVKPKKICEFEKVYIEE